FLVLADGLIRHEDFERQPPGHVRAFVPHQRGRQFQRVSGYGAVIHRSVSLVVISRFSRLYRSVSSRSAVMTFWRSLMTSKSSIWLTSSCSGCWLTGSPPVFAPLSPRS